MSSTDFESLHTLSNPTVTSARTDLLSYVPAVSSSTCTFDSTDFSLPLPLPLYYQLRLTCSHWETTNKQTWTPPWKRGLLLRSPGSMKQRNQRWEDQSFPKASRSRWPGGPALLPQCWRVLLQALGAEGQSQAPGDNGSWGGTYRRAWSVGLGRGGSKCSLCLLLAVLLLPLFLRENPKRFVPKTLKDLTPRMSLLGKQDTRTWQNTDFSSFLHTYKASALLDIQESHQDDRNLYFGRKWHLAYKQHED